MDPLAENFTEMNSSDLPALQPQGPNMYPAAPPPGYPFPYTYPSFPFPPPPHLSQPPHPHLLPFQMMAMHSSNQQHLQQQQQQQQQPLQSQGQQAPGHFHPPSSQPHSQGLLPRSQPSSQSLPPFLPSSSSASSSANKPKALLLPSFPSRPPYPRHPLPHHQLHRPPEWPAQVQQLWTDNPLPSSSSSSTSSSFPSLVAPVIKVTKPAEPLPTRSKVDVEVDAAEERERESKLPSESVANEDEKGQLLYTQAPLNIRSPATELGGRLLYNLQGAFPFQPPASSILGELSSPEEGTRDEGKYDLTRQMTDEFEDELIFAFLPIADEHYLLSLLAEDGDDVPLLNPVSPYTHLMTSGNYGETPQSQIGHRRIQSEGFVQLSKQTAAPSVPRNTPAAPPPSSLSNSHLARVHIPLDSNSASFTPFGNHEDMNQHQEQFPFISAPPIGNYGDSYKMMDDSLQFDGESSGFNTSLLMVDSFKSHRRSFSTGEYPSHRQLSGAHPHNHPSPALSISSSQSPPQTAANTRLVSKMKFVTQLTPPHSPTNEGGEADASPNAGSSTAVSPEDGKNILGALEKTMLLPPAPPLPTDKNSLQEYLSSRRSETQEPPATKRQFKAFCKELKLKEKDGYAAATEWAKQELLLLPPSAHYKVYMEVADLAKRQNRIKHARYYYVQVHRMQPFASQGWLEHAKMEEECGDMDRCGRVLSQGLFFCHYNENLLVKGIKHQERIGNIQAARSLLSRLKRVPVERTWKATLEGALMEARNGNAEIARRVFKYLMQHVPWHGPVYLEASRFEERDGHYDKSIQIIERGLVENQRYAPLWFAALRAYEKCDTLGGIDKVRETVQRAVKVITKELIWKVWFEAAQVEERTCWRLCSKTRREALHSHSAGEGRAKRGAEEEEEEEESIEGIGPSERQNWAGDVAFQDGLRLTRQAYAESVRHCPANLLWKVWLAGARTEINFGNISVGRRLLRRALKEVPQKMRAFVLMEVSRLEEYAGKADLARQILTKAREESVHEWKVFLESILLEVRCGDLKAALRQAAEALRTHSATGRLWAAMIQVSHIEGESVQEKVFRMALNEVPKSGEVWCEGARICLRRGQWNDAKEYLNFAIRFTPQYGDSFIEFLRFELLQCRQRLIHTFASPLTLTPEMLIHNADVAALEQLCLNVDPNYGAMWLSCKRHPLDSTRDIFRRAIRRLAKDICVLHETDARKRAREGVVGGGRFDSHVIIEPLHSDYASPLSLNSVHMQLTGEDRRRAIFGSDSIK